MSEYIFKMPDIGEGVVEAEITAWHIKVGQMVEEDMPVADAMTDKATVELTAPVSGLVLSIGCTEGEIMAIGGNLVVFQTDGDAPTPKEIPKQEAKTPTPKKQAPKPAPTPSPEPVLSAGSKPLASPAVRKAALDQNIDLTRVTPVAKRAKLPMKTYKPISRMAARTRQRVMQKRQA